METVQEIASIMQFVNEVMAKMKEKDRLSNEATAGLQCLLRKIEDSLVAAGEELTGWRKISGPAKMGEELSRKGKD